ncbi:MAG TPA: glycosyltransferase [Candidatus Methylacidiphilales bacterium]|nr:glycosyltransferase [Candidatus Methylacidiphilales bacterium]
MSRPLRIFTWHIHGSYLYYLSQVPHEFYIPVDASGRHGYGGKGTGYPWPANLIEVPTDKIKDASFDCILFQSRDQYLNDQFEIFNSEQIRLPKLYIEHDPPREHPTDTKHYVQSPDVMLVHVTPFNELMWDAGPTPTRVVEHGVFVPEDTHYLGDWDSGVVIINNIHIRGRRLGYDIWLKARDHVYLDLYGMGWEEAGGLGEVKHSELPGLLSHYRFFFNPIRYTSMGLAVCEAMATGLPIVGFATTEMATTIPNGIAGYVDTKYEHLLPHMRELLKNPALAAHLSKGAQKIARERFSMQRFIHDWCEVFSEVTGISSKQHHKSSYIYIPTATA